MVRQVVVAASLLAQGAEVTSLARRRLQPSTGDTEQAQEDTGQLWLVSGVTILVSDWSVGSQYSPLIGQWSQYSPLIGQW